MKLLRKRNACARTWARLTIAHTCAIVRAYASKTGDFRLHILPGDERITKRRVEDDGWCPLASAVNVHLVTT